MHNDYLTNYTMKWSTDGITWSPMGITSAKLTLKNNDFEIERVIFNAPATIVIWTDGSKTVVKAQNGEKYDAEKGLALAFMKKSLGNKGNFNNVLHKWCPTVEEE